MCGTVIVAPHELWNSKIGKVNDKEYKLMVDKTYIYIKRIPDTR